MSKRIILLTGATGGIGRETARLLLKNGDYPILVSRNKSTLHELRNELGSGDIFSCDVTQEEEVDQLVEQVLQRYGKVDILINNAGHGAFGGALDLAVSDYADMMETNYLGAVRLTQAFLPSMLQYGGGRIINIASVAGLTGIPNLSAYCASKFALIGFSEALKLEYSPRILVGVLCPGPVQTPFFKGIHPSCFFPAPIARQLIDAQTVAKHVIRLIERPRVKVIPRPMHWAIQLRNILPGFYLWATKKVYDSFKQEESHPARKKHSSTL